MVCGCRASRSQADVIVSAGIVCSTNLAGDITNRLEPWQQLNAGQAVQARLPGISSADWAMHDRHAMAVNGWLHEGPGYWATT